MRLPVGSSFWLFPCRAFIRKIRHHFRYIHLCEAENYCSVPPLHSFREKSLSLQRICAQEVDWTEHFRQTDTC